MRKCLYHVQKSFREFAVEKGKMKKAPYLVIAGRYFGAAIGMILLFWLSGWALRPSVGEKKPLPPREKIEQADQYRNLKMDKENPPVIYRYVDYSEGKAGSWWPKGESPVITPLVQAGKLPPVAERVGSEPAVAEGIEGIGKYGGTWARLATDANDAMNLPNNRMSYAALLRFSPQGYPIVPHVAKAWEVSDDNKEFTFYLRKGMKWSDGAPYTADDILYWWENEMMEPELTTEVPAEFRVRNERCQVVKIDDHAVKFVFPYPYGIFPTLMATHLGERCTQSPKHYLQKYHPVLGDKELIQKVMEQFNLPNQRAVYGHAKRKDNPKMPRIWPWVYRTYQEGNTQVYVRNAYYWMVDTQGNQLPYVDRCTYDAIGRQLLNIRASKEGGVTMQARHIDYKDYTNFMAEREKGKYEVYHWYMADRSLYVIMPNMNRKVYDDDPGSAQKAELLKNTTFRQAMSLAINRDAIIRAEYNGQAEPANCMPGPASQFYNEHAYKAFTGHDPDRANAMLDSIGLTQRDVEGFRTAPDGTRLTFYLDYCQFTGEGPAQFLLEDWQKVGIRVVPRERSRQLWSTERAALKHDFDVWIGDCEFVPTLTARHVVPAVNSGSGFALGYTRWYNRGGLYDPTVKVGIEPPKDHPLRKAMVIYEKVKQLSDFEEQKKAFKPLLEMAAKGMWTININTPPPYLMIVANGFRNVPKLAVYSWVFQSPGNTGLETFYFDKNADDEGTQKQITSAIDQIKPIPGSIKVEGDKLVAAPKGRLGSIVKYMLITVVILFLAMMTFKHPFVGRRLVIMVPTLLIISVIVFTIIQLPPGDYLTTRIMQLREAGDAVNMQEIEDIKDMFLLEKPMYVRYLHWLGIYWFLPADLSSDDTGSDVKWFGGAKIFNESNKGLLQGFMGRSMESSRVVNDIIGDRILLTFLISLGTILFTWSMAIPIGIYSAVKQYSVGDYIFTFMGFLGMSIPGFLFALVLSVAAGGLTGLFSPKFNHQAGWDIPKVIDLLKHIWVPIVVMGVSGTAGMIRVMRGNLLDELRKPYVVTALAKGVRPIRLLFKYPVRLALNPFISGIGGLFPTLVSGSAIVAIVLSLPTVGPLMLSALMSEDMLLAGSMLMVLSLLSIMGTLVSDLLLLWLDPRIRFKGGSR